MIAIVIIPIVWALRLLQLAVILRVVFTWLTQDQADEKQVEKYTKPIDVLLKPFSIKIQMGRAYTDIGPMLVLLLIEGICRVLLQLA